ncbi:MAG TPA: carboxypeptidase-like regulatory domain-containing protein [Pyrinomonadaceae bacterium]|nr:carboxypeptidase-like regulatory domain-containing protein [Pyrinomonadaceae bacterium]
MSSSTQFLAVFFFMLLCIPGPLLAQSSTKPPSKSPCGSVSGRVTIKDKPAAGVTVGLRQTTGVFPLEKSYRAVTDHEGVYHITNVPAGSYEIMTAAPAYVTAEVNGPRSKSVIVGEDENVEDINFSLVRGGVITGKVIDADGRPLVQQQVYLYRVDSGQQPARQVGSTGNVQTDDRGIYRFFGLAAGRYKVACGRSEESDGNYFYQFSRVTYKQVFYPDTTDQAKAAIVEVREGSEATNIDITLGAPVQTFNVSGRVVEGEKGLPVPNIRFAFQRRTGERFEIVESTAVSNGRGDFTAEGLLPGKYGIILFGNADREIRAEALSFEVVDQDVTGLTVRLVKGSSISGVVVLESEDKRVFAKLVELQLRGYVTAAAGTPTVGQSTSSSIAPDGSFRLPGLSPGQVNIWLTAGLDASAPKGFTILRIEHNGIAAPRGIEIKEGDQLTGVRVVVGYGTASIRGTVKIENGTLPEGARLIARLLKPGTPPTPIAASQVDARGQFLMEGIPAGVYEVQITTFVPNTRSQQSAKREVNVQDGVVNEVTVTLDLTTPPKP